MTNNKYLGILVPLILLLLVGSDHVGATIIWQDTFDDSSSLDNYEIVNGDLRSDGVLTSLGCDAVDCIFGSTYFYRSSLGASGTWSFDYNLTSSLSYFFIGIGKVSGHALFPKQGYNLVIRPSQKSFSLDYVSTSISNLASYTSEKSLVGWMHIDITRDDLGEIIVYLDGDSIIKTTQVDLTSSEHINIQLTKDSQLDNLKYSNTVDPAFTKSKEDDSPLHLNTIIISLILTVFTLRQVRKAKLN